MVEAPYYTFGLWMYDRLSGKLSIGKTRYLGQGDARRRLKGVRDDKIGAGVCYYDGQFDDAVWRCAWHRPPPTMAPRCSTTAPSRR